MEYNIGTKFKLVFSVIVTECTLCIKACRGHSSSTVEHFLHYPGEMEAVALVMLTPFLHLPYETIISRTDVMLCAIILSCSLWRKSGLCGCKWAYRESMYNSYSKL